MNKDWLERELSSQLAPVEAPRDLWSSVTRRRIAARDFSRNGLVLWPVIAVVFAVASGDLLLQLAGGPVLPLSLRQMTQKPVRGTVLEAALYQDGGSYDPWAKCTVVNHMHPHATVSMASGHWIAEWRSESPTELAERHFAPSPGATVKGAASWSATECGSCHIDGRGFDGRRFDGRSFDGRTKL